MNKIIPTVIVLAVLQIAQSEILSLIVLLAALCLFLGKLLKEAAERN